MHKIKMDRLLENIEILPTAALLSVSAVLLYYYLGSKRTHYPAGPRALPFIGNLHQIALAGGVREFVEANHNIYGNIFTIEIAGYKKIVLSGYENFHKFLVKNSDHTSTRSGDSMGPTFREITRDAPGLIWASYPQWKVLRTFVMASMKEDGMGHSAMEPRIIEEIIQFIERFIKPSHGSPIDLSHSLQQAACNIVSQLVYARRFEYDDELFNEMIAASAEGLQLGALTSVLDHIPLAKFFIQSTLRRERVLRYEIQYPALTRYIDDVRESMDPDDPNCLIGRFVTQSQLAKGDEKAAYFSHENALGLSLQLYEAGSETTASALRWALLYMCLDSGVQHRVQAEIDGQIGKDRTVSYKDKLLMPFTEAVLLETLRISNIVPTGLPRTLEKEMEVDGMILPAGVDLMFNFASVLHDDTVFEKPHLFNPDRYLEGDITLKKQRTISFGLGKRACIGESLARMEFFMFFVTFLQLYNVRLPEGSSTDTSAAKSLITRIPRKYELIFEPRL